MIPETLQHPIPPVFDTRSEVLILGSFPSPASRDTAFFYGHPQNRMWRVLATIFNEPTPSTNEWKRDFLLRNHIAMWDVLASCTIEGARDASIANEVPNNLEPLIQGSSIKAIFCAGATASKFYAAYCEPQLGIPCIPMPSTSPANAAWNLDKLVDSWSVIRTYITEEERPVLDVERVISLEQEIAAAGTPLAHLMDHAGNWLAYQLHAQWPCARVVVLAGNGNNGGDGWVAARMLAQWGHDVSLVTAKEAHDITAQPAHDAAVYAESEFDALKVSRYVCPSKDELDEILARADVIVDAILGTGFTHSKVRPPFDTWIEAANTCRSQGAAIVSADCPSGIDAQTGKSATPCIQADMTVTMITSKTGLHTEEGLAHCGTIQVAPLCDIRAFL